MNPPATTGDYGFFARLRNAGSEPGDDADVRLNKQLLMFATGLISIATMLWLLIYDMLGPHVTVHLARIMRYASRP